MDKYVVVVAGGKGLRMGGDVPKQFVPIAGQPVLMRTLRLFAEAEPEAQLILALPRDHQPYWQQLCREYGFDVPHVVADGGQTRFHSVQNALRLIPQDACGIVAVHDGVRPFVSHEVVRRCMCEAWETGAVVPVTPVVETLRRMLPDGETQTVDRNLFRLVQTPQTFRIDLLKKAYEQPYCEAFTDDASVVEVMGHHVCLVDGNRENIKLTTPADMKYAEYLCRA